MDFNFDDIFGVAMDDLFMTFYLSLIPGENDRETTKNIFTVFKKHGINTKDTISILTDLSKVLEPGKADVVNVKVDSLQMAYNVLHNAYSQTKATKDELMNQMLKVTTILNPKNRKENAALVILRTNLNKPKITKKELRDAIRRAAEELCK